MDCSGHGTCTPSGHCLCDMNEQFTGEGEATRACMTFQFCSCVISAYYGVNCSIPVLSTDTARKTPYAEFNDCNDYVVCPALELSLLDFVFGRFNAVQCSAHGVCAHPRFQNVYNYMTSYYRPQTFGICYCEPGYSGEQCAGGKPVPASLVSCTHAGSPHCTLQRNACPVFTRFQVMFAIVAAYVATMLAIYLYRIRKIATVYFDAENETPSDYTVFINNLRDMGIKVWCFTSAQLELMMWFRTIANWIEMTPSEQFVRTLKIAAGFVCLMAQRCQYTPSHQLYAMRNCLNWKNRSQRWNQRYRCVWMWLAVKGFSRTDR